MTRGEVRILILTIIFQIISLVTLLRVATGIASANPPPNQTNPPIIVPSSLNQRVSVPDSTPQFQSPTGNNLDASLLLALFFVAANTAVIGLLAYLYRKKKMKLFSLLVSVFLVFNVTELYFSFILGLYSVVPTIAALVGVALTVVSALKGMGKLANGLAILLALELGSSFPVLLQAPLNWIIPTVYAVFDVYAVYFGRLGKLVKQVSSDDPQEKESIVTPRLEDRSKRKIRDLSRWKDFGLLSVNVGDLDIGMADLAFYSMVPAVALLLKNLFSFFVVMLAVDAGLLLSFKVFSKKEISPGLPIPILSGLGSLLILSLVI